MRYFHYVPFIISDRISPMYPDSTAQGLIIVNVVFPFILLYFECSYQIIFVKDTKLNPIRNRIRKANP